jgi:intracellular septation protein
MKFLVDFFPLLLFFVALKFWGIYVATAVAIAASLIQVGWFYHRHRRAEVVHIVTLAVILIFGGLTLWLQDETFIKLKPTIVNAIFAAILLGTQWFGKKTAIEHLMGSQLELPQPVWRSMNLSWALFLLFLAAANIYVAFFYGRNLAPEVQTEHWATFKVFGLTAAILIFSVLQMLYISRRVDLEKAQRNKA